MEELLDELVVVVLELVVVGVVVVEVVVGVLVVLVVVGVVVEEEVVVVVVVLELVVLEVVWQSTAASCPTVLAPCIRLPRSVALTDGGRFMTAFVNPETAVAAAPQWLPATARDTASSWLLRFED